MTNIPLFITTNNPHSTRQIEIRLSSDDPISSIKNRLQLVTGWPPMYMNLSLYRGEMLIVSDMDSGSCHPNNSLSMYSVQPYDRLHVICTNSILLNDSSQDIYKNSKIKKFELSDEAYSKLPDNAAKWKSRILNDKKTPKASAFTDIPAFQIGDRVLIRDMKKQPLDSQDLGEKATIHYIGTVHFATGQWIGISYDNPIGKHDGSVDDTRYFKTKDNHGSFVKPDRVHIIYSQNESINFDEELVEL